MARAVKEFHPVLKRGDAFLHNSPYHGNSHAADHTILVPVIDDDGVHRFTVLTKAHQADCGNALPTTYMGTAIDVYAEGALIFPAVKVQAGLSRHRRHRPHVRNAHPRARASGRATFWRWSARRGSASVRCSHLAVRWDGTGSKRSPDSGSISASNGWPRASGRCRRVRRPASSVHDAIPGTPSDGVRVVATVEVASRRGQHHHRFARQYRCLAVRPQPDRGMRRYGRSDRRIQQHRRRHSA